MTEVLIYTTPSCSYCKMTKEFLQENKVYYTEKDVAENEAAANEMFQRSQQMGVPVIFVTKDGKESMIIGFDEEKLKDVLRL